MCESFYILHVNKCGFLVCRLANAETIPTSISQRDKLKLNQAQPPYLHHLSHLYHPNPPCTHSLLVHHLSHCHHSNSACTPSLLVHFFSHGQALPGHVQHTKLACTSHPAQVHHSRPAYTSHALLIQPKCTILDQYALFIQPKCTIPVQHAQHCHTFSTTPIQHTQLQSKCTPDPHRIIQSNCTTQLRQQSNSKTEEEKDGHI